MRTKRPDPKNALSIIAAAEEDMSFTRTLSISEHSAATIVRNTYESFRKLGDALLISKGIVSHDHIAPVKELTSLNLETTRPLHLIDNLRRLRHNTNYYGYKPSESEAQNAISLSEEFFDPIATEIKKRLEK